MIWLSGSTLKPDAAVPPRSTAVAPVKRVRVTVTRVPPPAASKAGLMPLAVGGSEMPPSPPPPTKPAVDGVAKLWLPAAIPVAPDRCAKHSSHGLMCTPRHAQVRLGAGPGALRLTDVDRIPCDEQSQVGR